MKENDEDNYDYSLITLPVMIIFGVVCVFVVWVGIGTIVNFIFNLITN